MNNNPEIIIPTIQSLFIEMLYNDKLLATGTGFLINKNDQSYLITNRHNVTGRDNFTGQILDKNAALPNYIRIWHHKKNSLGQWIPITEPLFDINENPCWFEHPFLKCKADFVALKLNNLINVDLYPYHLDADDPLLKLHPTDIVSVIGFPFGFTASGFNVEKKLAIWATGFIATDTDIDYSDLPIFLIDCRTREGQSGSAVVHHRNGGVFNIDSGFEISNNFVTKLLGIYSGRINKDSDLGLVWKIQAIRDLINSI